MGLFYPSLDTKFDQEYVTENQPSTVLVLLSERVTHEKGEENKNWNRCIIITKASE